MFTFSSESHYDLIGCGIDGEAIDRFTRLIDQNEPMPMVFSRREIEYIRSLSGQAEAFCASFCCKEAIFKALGQPFSFPQCELFYSPGQVVHRPSFSFVDDTPIHIQDCTVSFFFPHRDEMVVVAHLFGRTGP